ARRQRRSAGGDDDPGRRQDRWRPRAMTKQLFSIGAAALALALAGCGGSGGNSSNLSSATGATSAPLPQIAAPNNGDWTETVTLTERGGFLMGNPNAPVKLLEYASITCPHCAEFSEQGGA